MFGHNDDNQQKQTDDQPAPPAGIPGFTPPPVDPTPAATLDETADTDDKSETDDSTSSLPGDMRIPEPSKDESAAPEPATTAPTPADGAESSSIEDNHQPSDVPEDLVKLKQEALEHLSPLVDHLDQSPEERFRTTMMMIQATDDSSKIKDAYDAAQKIEDEKVRAQALLDVVNEINYFTQQHKG